MPKRPFTPKQQAFIDEYCINGENGLQAAKAAKYKGNDNALSQRAYELVRNSNVKAEIDRRIAEIKAKCIANREQRQQFWTRVMSGSEPGCTMGDKLRASELLGKSEADFTDNLNTGDTSIPELTEAERARLKFMAQNLLRDKQKTA